jgi:hypothetical protein
VGRTLRGRGARDDRAAQRDLQRAIDEALD